MEGIQKKSKEIETVANKDRIQPEERSPLKLTPPKIEGPGLCQGIVEEIKALSE